MTNLEEIRNYISENELGDKIIMVEKEHAGDIQVMLFMSGFNNATGCGIAYTMNILVDGEDGDILFSESTEMAGDYHKVRHQEDIDEVMSFVMLMHSYANEMNYNAFHLA